MLVDEFRDELLRSESQLAVLLQCSVAWSFNMSEIWWCGVDWNFVSLVNRLHPQKLVFNSESDLKSSCYRMQSIKRRNPWHTNCICMIQVESFAVWTTIRSLEVNLMKSQMWKRMLRVRQLTCMEWSLMKWKLKHPEASSCEPSIIEIGSFNIFILPSHPLTIWTQIYDILWKFMFSFSFLTICCPWISSFSRLELNDRNCWHKFTWKMKLESWRVCCKDRHDIILKGLWWLCQRRRWDIEVQIAKFGNEQAKPAGKQVFKTSLRSSRRFQQIFWNQRALGWWIVPIFPILASHSLPVKQRIDFLPALRQL